MFRRLPLIFLLIPTVALFYPQEVAFSATSSVEFTLNGVLISPASRSALVNGKVVREGEYVDGVEILAIDEDAVHVLSGSEEYAVPVGSGAWLQPSAALAASTTKPRPGSSIRRVNSGDTLSAIAEDYAGGGLSLYQVMVALFDANPQAFDGNINRLHAGAQLRIPEILDMRRLEHGVAVAEVMRQVESWRSGLHRPNLAAEALEPIPADPVDRTVAHDTSEYGPVRFGETLSEIALQVSGDDVSMNEMMAALFEVNPHAFGDSIDLLHEGAVLRVPGIDEINQPPTMAANNYR